MRDVDMDAIGTEQLLELARGQLRRWTRDALDMVPPDEQRIDAHCHLGVDSDGSRIDVDQLLVQLDEAGMHAACVTPLHQSDGYAAENARLRQVAAGSEGRLHALHRCDPAVGDPAADARSGLEAGAVGLKWHPRAEAFGMHDPVAEQTAAVANEFGAGILIHAGRGMERLGEGVVELACENPGATFVLAHAAISDLAWIVDATHDVPNVVFDTSWWRPTDLAVLLATCDPGRVLHGSDPPYGSAQLGLQLTARIARGCGWGDEAMAALLGGNARRVFGIGEPTAAADPGRHTPHLPHEVPAFRRASELLAAAMHVQFGGGDSAEVSDLAIAALDLVPSHELHDQARLLQAAICAGCSLLARDHERHHAPDEESFMTWPTTHRLGVQLLICTLAHLATPALPIQGIDGVSFGDPAPFV
jgi:uncharacterized protein